MFTRPCHTHVTQTTLFLETSARFSNTALMWKQTVFHAGDKYRGKLKALGGMQCHQLYTVVPGFTLGFTGFKRSMAEEGLQVRHTGLLIFLWQDESLGGVNQFTQVFHPRFHFFVRFFFVMCNQLAVLNNTLHLVSK